MIRTDPPRRHTGARGRDASRMIVSTGAPHGRRCRTCVGQTQADAAGDAQRRGLRRRRDRAGRRRPANEGKVIAQTPAAGTQRRARAAASCSRSASSRHADDAPPTPTTPDRDLALARWYARARPPRPAVARDARPLGGARVRGDAPPDAGAARRARVCDDVHRRGSPTPAAMAAAGPGAVIAAWGRLGYPRRARRLWEAAVVIAARRLARRPHRRCPASAATPRPRSPRRPTTPTCPRIEVNVRRVVRARARRAALDDARPKRAMVEIGRAAARPRPAARADGRRRDCCADRAHPRATECPLAAPVRDARRAGRRDAVTARRRSRDRSGSGAAA